MESLAKVTKQNQKKNNYRYGSARTMRIVHTKRTRARCASCAHLYCRLWRLILILPPLAVSAARQLKLIIFYFFPPGGKPAIKYHQFLNASAIRFLRTYGSRFPPF